MFHTYSRANGAPHRHTHSHHGPHRPSTDRPPRRHLRIPPLTWPRLRLGRLRTGSCRSHRLPHLRIHHDHPHPGEEVDRRAPTAKTGIGPGEATGHTRRCLGCGWGWQHARTKTPAASCLCAYLTVSQCGCDGVECAPHVYCHGLGE